MAVALPPLDAVDFARELDAVAPAALRPLGSFLVEALYSHFRELRRWSARASLIGPGTVAEIFARHYGESLAAVPLLPPAARRLLDFGSGAGFPGLVLAAARPDLEVTLVEARQKKWAFLQAAARRAGLSCRVLDARVGRHVPPGLTVPVDILTARAVKLPEVVLATPEQVLAPDGRLLLWAGETAPDLPAGWVTVAEHPLAGLSRRLLIVAAEPKSR